MNPFKSLRNYEKFVYSISQVFPSVRNSSLVLIVRGRSTAVLRGDVIFESGYRLSVLERLSSENDTLEIESYGYEIWQGSEKFIWYDSQPHPNDLVLKSSFPHHKHVPPNIKHNRIPAPHISFVQPNLPVLIEEIEKLVKKEKNHDS